jgi:hypothetical protein
METTLLKILIFHRSSSKSSTVRRSWSKTLSERFDSTWMTMLRRHTILPWPVCDYQVYHGCGKKSHWPTPPHMLHFPFQRCFCPHQSSGHVSSDNPGIPFDTDIRFGLVDADQWRLEGEMTVVKRWGNLGRCHLHHPWHFFVRQACNAVTRATLYIFCG